MLTNANTNNFDSLTENLPDGDYVCTFIRGNQIMTTQVKYMEKNYLEFALEFGFYMLNHVSGVIPTFADGITMVGEPFPSVGSGNRYDVTCVGYIMSPNLLRGDIILGLTEIEPYMREIDERVSGDDATESDYALYFRDNYLDLPGIKDIIAIQNNSNISVGIMTDIIYSNDMRDSDHVNIDDIEENENYHYYRLAIVRDLRNDVKSYYVINGTDYVSPYGFGFKMNIFDDNMESKSYFIINTYMLVVFGEPLDFTKSGSDKFEDRDVLELEGIAKYDLIDAMEV